MSLTLAQRDAYRQSLRTLVLSCVPRDGAFNVRLADTVLYATGGGQPADRGTIGGANVLDVVKTADGVVHVTDMPVELAEVEVVVDWTRRFDFMQQHTAQHLVTAIADDEFGLSTVSFHLGDEYCAIEFACDAPPEAEVWRDMAVRVNAEIRSARAVEWRSVSVSEYQQMDTVRSRGLPDGHVGDVRLVEIAGIDLNTCGGTHVATTGELQVVRLGRVEKTTDGVRLHYFAGGRVLGAMEADAQRASDIGALLSCGPAGFVEGVRKMQADLKASLAQSRSLREELAVRIADELNRSESPVVTLRRPESDLAFFNAIANGVDAGRCLVIVGDGVFLVAGVEADVAAVGPAVRDALGGRGGGRGDRFQGKSGESADADVAFAAAQHAFTQSRL